MRDTTTDKAVHDFFPETNKQTNNFKWPLMATNVKVNDVGLGGSLILRRSEVARMRASDLDPSGNQARVGGGGGANKPRL